MESISKIAKINLRPHRKGKKDDHKGIGKGRGGEKNAYIQKMSQLFSLFS